MTERPPIDWRHSSERPRRLAHGLPHRPFHQRRDPAPGSRPCPNSRRSTGCKRASGGAAGSSRGTAAGADSGRGSGRGPCAPAASSASSTRSTTAGARPILPARRPGPRSGGPAAPRTPGASPSGSAARHSPAGAASQRLGSRRFSSVAKSIMGEEIGRGQAIRRSRRSWSGALSRRSPPRRSPIP